MALSKYLLAQSDHVVYRHAPQHQYALCGPASLLWGTHATDNQTNKHRRTEGSGYRRYLLPWFCHCGPTLVASDDKERKSFWLLEVYNSEQTLWSRWLDILSTDWGGMSKLGQARHRWSMVCFQYNLANTAIISFGYQSSLLTDDSLSPDWQSSLLNDSLSSWLTVFSLDWHYCRAASE